MNKLIIALALTCSALTVGAEKMSPLRAPAYPLVTIDPYISAWSMTDNLYDREISHWTATPMPLLGVIKVDGIPYRFMGAELPRLVEVIPTASTGDWHGRYVTHQPSGEWWQVGYDDSGWDEAPGAFGSIPQEPAAKTAWTGDTIWVRRQFSMPAKTKGKPIYLNYSHDDDVMLYINGIKVVDSGNACHKDARLRLPANVISSLKSEGNVIAARCYDRGGLAFLDFGLDYEPTKSLFFTKTAEQTGAEVRPMNTVYDFRCGPVALNLTFTAPSFLDNLDLLSRPVNYISYEVKSLDGKKHDVELYFEAGREWAVSHPKQKSRSAITNFDGLVAVSTANIKQNPLNKGGDHTRIDWGEFYLAAPSGKCKAFTCAGPSARQSFISDKEFPAADVEDIGLVMNLGATKKASGYLMAAFDDIYGVQYFGQNLRPYWNRQNNSNIRHQLATAARDYRKLMAATKKFDKELIDEATTAGGDEYAALCALAYRQSVATHKLVESPSGEILWLSKENDSNGSIGTVDITYPSAPMYLIYNPELVKGMMNHIFEYSESGRWTKPFPSHDVGTYPLANGQTYGGDMPVEEAGNMLCLSAVVAAVEGNAEYARKHWDTLTTWTDYLTANGLDPENQLCTDDFAGHFAHNANLSIKAILGIASYAYLAEQLGQTATAEKYSGIARKRATEWEKMANDGNHYRLTFDKPGSWSQKYNLLWDKLLGLNIFPSKIIETEIAWYLGHQNLYGLPLDNRETYTKTDWIIWTATLAPDKATFMKFISPVYKFMNETTDRVAMSDWIFTDKPVRRGFTARSVVGGYFAKMLEKRLRR